jgi:NAD(P)H-nitrite reductase large subunit
VAGGAPVPPPAPGAAPGAGPFLCVCFRLTAADLRRRIAAGGWRTLEDVAEGTGACRGCRTCAPDIEALLAERGGA